MHAFSLSLLAHAIIVLVRRGKINIFLFIFIFTQFPTPREIYFSVAARGRGGGGEEGEEQIRKFINYGELSTNICTYWYNSCSVSIR